LPGKLLLAPFGCSDATERLLGMALATGTEPRDILYLCPSPRKLRDVQLRFFRKLAQPAVVPPRFVTLSQLAADLHERYGSAREFPADIKPLLLRRLMSPVRRRPPSGEFLSPTEAGEPLSPSLGHASAVATFIRDIKSYVPTADRAGLAARLTGLLEGFETPRRRALDALEVMRKYDELLGQKGWADREDILAWAAGCATQHLEPRLLVLDSFVSPNRLEQNLLLALSEAAGTTLALGFSGPGDEYRVAAVFCDLFRDRPGFAVEELTANRPEPAARLVAFPTLEDEVAGICRSICDRGAAINLVETVVTFPDLSDYAPVVRRVFEQYNLPVTVYPETNLAASPPVMAVLELLTALDSGYERTATAAALGSPYLPGLLRLPGEKDATGRDRAAAALNHYSRRGRIIKDRLNWRNIAERVAAAEDRSLDEAESAFVADLQRRVRQAIGLTEKLLEPADTAGNQSRRLKQFLEAADFCRNCEPGDGDELTEDRSTVYDLLDAIAAFDDEFGARPEPRSDFIRTLRSLITRSARTPEPTARGITVMSLAETLGIVPKHLYIGGLTERSLPGAYSGDPILPDSARRQLGMPDIDWRRDWQKFHFRRTLESSPDAPFLSFHDSDNGKPVLPTPFLVAEHAKPRDSGTSHSPSEAQLAGGERSGRLFAERTQVVDFAGDHEVVKELSRRFGPARALSVTSIERYRRCPYQFYLEYVLGLETPPEPTYDIDAQQWGLVVHRVLEKLYEHGSVPLATVEAKATAILEDALREANLPAFWQQVTRRVFANLLPGFVELEAELREDGFEPIASESSVAGAISKDIVVRGRLDRVDASAKAVHILDYKTGSTAGFRAKAVVEDRTHVQLPLYAKLIRDGKEHRNVENMGVYSLRDLRVIWFAGKDYSVDQLIQAAVENTVEVVAGIRSGRFPAEPADDSACRYCTLGHTCGQVEKKDSE
jgi:RecB family exonuclease